MGACAQSESTRCPVALEAFGINGLLLRGEACLGESMRACAPSCMLGAVAFLAHCVSDSGTLRKGEEGFFRLATLKRTPALSHGFLTHVVGLEVIEKREPFFIGKSDAVFGVVALLARFPGVSAFPIVRSASAVTALTAHASKV